MSRNHKADPHGQRRMPINILTSWGALLIQTVSGFIIPRLVDNDIGQSGLGVWDFCWTLVAYFGLVAWLHR
jgi:hypothetical protein